MVDRTGAVSKRGVTYADPANKAPMLDVVCDLWHPESNPDGYLSLGVAENVSTASLLLNVGLTSFPDSHAHRAHGVYGQVGESLSLVAPPPNGSPPRGLRRQTMLREELSWGNFSTQFKVSVDISSDSSVLTATRSLMETASREAIASEMCLRSS